MFPEHFSLKSTELASLVVPWGSDQPFTRPPVPTALAVVYEVRCEATPARSCDCNSAFSRRTMKIHSWQQTPGFLFVLPETASSGKCGVGMCVGVGVGVGSLWILSASKVSKAISDAISRVGGCVVSSSAADKGEVM